MEADKQQRVDSSIGATELFKTIQDTSLSHDGISGVA